MAEIKLERQQEPARLRVYIGAAPGVGKTYDMLNDAYRMKHQQGMDVVIGLVELTGAMKPQPVSETSRLFPSVRFPTAALL